jgi:5'-nucleotidase
VILGVDLDGVCGDFSAAFQPVIAADLGIDMATMAPRANWDFTEWGVRDAEHYAALHREAVLEHRIFRTMPVIEGCAEALWRLSDAGIWIRIITHRLYLNWGHQEAVSDTVAWLDDAGIPYRDLCFLGAKPEVEADVYIDDAPHNVLALRDAGNEVIVFGQPYNTTLEDPRAESWADVEQLVLARLVEQGEHVQDTLPGFAEGPARLHRRRRPLP